MEAKGSKGIKAWELMEDFGADAAEFPGFQTNVAHRDDIVYRRSLTRLQRCAPHPLSLPRPTSFPSCGGASKQPPPLVENNNNCSSFSSTSNNASFHCIDPIPLLSPLVCPSLFESHCVIEKNVTTKSSRT
ncbi:hypothetical protein Csa_018305, partial [Cucumis sativus]